MFELCLFYPRVCRWLDRRSRLELILLLPLSLIGALLGIIIYISLFMLIFGVM